MRTTTVQTRTDISGQLVISVRPVGEIYCGWIANSNATATGDKHAMKLKHMYIPMEYCCAASDMQWVKADESYKSFHLILLQTYSNISHLVLFL